MNSSDVDSDNDEGPTSVECFDRCKKFVELTGTDTALAMFYLQDVNWNLEKALEIYFNATNPTKSKVVACFDIDQLNKDEEEFQNKEEENENLKKRFKLLSWNIDGLDPSNLESRTNGVINVIAKEEPDVIFFQEVIKTSYKILKENLESEYTFITSVDNIDNLVPKSYFTMILLNNDTCKLENEKEIIEYNNTMMSRNLLKAKIIYRNKIKISTMTTHLESTVEFSKQRIDQLRMCLKEIVNEKDDYYVLFGGDLNLRDSELEGIGGLPNGIYDLWQSTGARKECLYTWDCLRNHNLTMNGKFKPRCRFDRLFYRKSKIDDENLRLSPVYFELEGLEKLKSCSRFCSDHWAIQCYFDLIQSN